MNAEDEQAMHALAVQLEQLTRGTGWEAMRYGQIGTTMERLATFCAVEVAVARGAAIQQQLDDERQVMTSDARMHMPHNERLLPHPRAAATGGVTHPPDNTSRVLALAKEAAWDAHLYARREYDAGADCGASGHEAPKFAECPHADCVLVRTFQPESEVARLRSRGQALVEYVTHKNCAVGVGRVEWRESDRSQCSCGLAALRPDAPTTEPQP